jgi:hypothetical protein
MKLLILENFTLYLRNSWSLNLRAIEDHFTDSVESNDTLNRKRLHAVV